MVLVVGGLDGPLVDIQDCRVQAIGDIEFDRIVFRQLEIDHLRLLFRPERTDDATKGLAGKDPRSALSATAYVVFKADFITTVLLFTPIDTTAMSWLETVP